MSVVAVLIGFSLLVAVGFLFAFLWAVKSGQYDDRFTPSVRILFDDAVPVKGTEKKSDTKDSKINQDTTIKENT